MSTKVSQDEVEVFEMPLTGRTVRIYEDEETPSGKNWEFLDE